MREEWLFPGAIVPVDVETTASLVTEIKRLIDVVGGMALAQPEQPKVRTGDCLLVGVCASEGHKIQPQLKPLSEEEIQTYRHMIDWTAEWSYINFARAIEAAHGIKGEA